LHFYSNWIIKDSNIHSDTWVINVNLWTTASPLDFGSHPGPGLYQVNRLASSAYSCFITNDTTFLDLVRLNFDIPIANVDNGNYLPLRAFTKKPVYTQTGPAEWSDGTINLICDPYCDVLTTALTMSPEVCLANNNLVTSACNNNGFSQVPPFTDLSYPPNVQIQSQSVGSNTTTIVIVCVVVGVILLVVAIGLVVWRIKKQRRGYQEI